MYSTRIQLDEGSEWKDKFMRKKDVKRELHGSLNGGYRIVWYLGYD